MAIAWGQRALTALVGIPLALCLLVSDVGVLLLATSLCCLSLVEFTGNICPPIVPQAKTETNKHLHRLLIVASGAVLCAGAWTGVRIVYDTLRLGTLLTMFTFHVATARRVDQTALVKLLLDLFALLYIVDGFGHAILLRYSSSKYGLGLLLLGLCCAWVCDSAALVAGTLLGNTKLAPVVSPGKTYVGTIAGIASSIATVLSMFALSDFATALSVVRGDWPPSLLPPPQMVPFSHQVLLGVVLGALCILGDLVESFVKRVAGVKDSGAFFPGHGGCLDRMDSFLFVAPCLHYYCQFALT